jgi:hypothetical protein
MDADAVEYLELRIKVTAQLGGVPYRIWIVKG